MARHAASTRSASSPLRGRHTSDITVVGSGITGSIAALFLLRSGRSVTLLEARTTGAGETSKSTGHLTELLDRRFHLLIRRFGVERLLRLTEAHRMAIHRIGSLSLEISPEDHCGFRRLPGYLYAESETQTEELHRELEALEKLHIPSALVRHVPLPFSVPHAIRIENQAQIQPALFNQRLLEAFVREGGMLHENSRVTAVHSRNKGVEIQTEHGGLHSEWCLLATHSPILAPSVSQLECVPQRTYALSARLRNAPLMDGLFWDMQSPYHYLSMSEGLLTVGGEDHRTGEAGLIETHAIQRLEEYVRARFEVGSIASTWSGQIFESVDGLPLVGASLRSERILYATGFSGNGLSMGVLCGLVLSELAQGRREDLTTLLAPHRMNRVRDLGRWISNNVQYPRTLARSLSRHELKPELLAPGEAEVGTLDGRRVACYRDPSGHTHLLSARCPHLGGEVSFNELEKTWDCPGHGSRFQATGEVLSGPACEALAPIEKPHRKTA